MEVVITRMDVWQKMAQGQNKGEEVRGKIHPIQEEILGKIHPIQEEVVQAQEGVDQAPVEVHHQETGKIWTEILGQTTKEVLVQEMEKATK